MKAYLLLVSFLLLPFSVNAQVITFDQLAEIAAPPEALHGRFIQKKYLQIVDAHLLSSGVFNYTQGKALHWETQEPIKSELIIDKASVISKQSGNVTSEIKSADNPSVAVINEVLFAVLTAQWSLLSKHFLLSGSVAGENWIARLTPKQAAIQKVVSGIEIKGDRLLKQLTLLQVGGDTTTIDFEPIEP